MNHDQDLRPTGSGGREAPPDLRIATLTFDDDGEPHRITLTGRVDTAQRLARHLDVTMPLCDPDSAAADRLRRALLAQPPGDQATAALLVADAARLCAFTRPGDLGRDVLDPLYWLLMTTVFMPFYDNGPRDVVRGTVTPVPQPDVDLRVTALHFDGRTPRAVELRLARDVAGPLAVHLARVQPGEGHRTPADRLRRALTDAEPASDGRITVIVDTMDAARLCQAFGRLPDYDHRHPVMRPLTDLLDHVAFQPFHRNGHLDVLFPRVWPITRFVPDVDGETR
ncbi:hypothetical protein [Saccharothrix sp. HUAS TT1]|uniref:hypothetical protein n=1 Tax=unclassified Saccharothrix TaxID=2593673 RepID=UPI00345BE563